MWQEPEEIGEILHHCIIFCNRKSTRINGNHYGTGRDFVHRVREAGCLDPLPPLRQLIGGKNPTLSLQYFNYYLWGIYNYFDGQTICSLLLIEIICIWYGEFIWSIFHAPCESFSHLALQ